MLVTSSGYVCAFPPCSTSAFIVIVLILSSSFSYNIPLDDFLSSLLLGLTLQSFLLALSIRVVPPDIGIAEDVGHRKLSDFDVYNLIQKFLRFFFYIRSMFRRRRRRHRHRHRRVDESTFSFFYFENFRSRSIYSNFLIYETNPLIFSHGL